MSKEVVLKIHGEVQGVFYRAYSHDKAQELGLYGWVRNMPDGSVEMCLQGSKDAIQQMIEWCHEGPPSSQVEHIEVAWRESKENLDSFEIRY